MELLQSQKSSCLIFLGLKGQLSMSDLSIFKKRIFKEKRLIQVQSWKLEIHWGILASTRKINLESYSLVLEVFVSQVATFEIKVSAKNMALF